LRRRDSSSEVRNIGKLSVTHRANEQSNKADTCAGILLGLCIGVILGISIGVALDSAPIGIAIGAGVGVSLATAFSRRREEPSEPMTIAGGIVLTVVGIIVLAVVLHIAQPQWWCAFSVLNLLPGC
jgi:drug/metabolite transporter (DMT)-like permease